MKRGPTEADLLMWIQLTELSPRQEREWKFCAGRRWRFDFALMEPRIGIEIDGGAWSQGRHTRGKGFIADMEKQNFAVLLGWRVLRFTPQQVIKGEAIEFIRMVLEGK